MSRFVIFVAGIFLSLQVNAHKVEPKNVKKMFNYLKQINSSPSREMLIAEGKSEYKINIDLYDILVTENNYFWDDLIDHTAKLNELSKDTINLFKTMDRLDAEGSLEEKLKFIGAMSPAQIERIYKIRNLYNPLSKILGFADGPSLKAYEMNGIYQGRSAVRGANNFRTFQKAFYTVDRNGVSYVVGHNISNVGPRISSHGSFRVYENSYPLYLDNGVTIWKKLQDGTLSLSYEEEDMLPVEGLRYNQHYPYITDYNYIFKNNKKIRVNGNLFYTNLKDQIFKINDSFITSFAFRKPKSSLPNTHFLMTKKCELIEPHRCPNII